MTATFGAESTADEVLSGIDLVGKRALVTGVSAGLGVETVRVLVAHGAHVVGTARDLDKARRALETAFAETARGASIELVEADLASLRSVRAAAGQILAKGGTFDAIIANAGVMACPKGQTTDGFETQFGTNHLGHFVFVNHLVPMLKSDARVVSVSSAGHQVSDVNLEDPNFERTDYHPFAAYGRSKTANVLYAVALDRRLKGRGIHATALHPGGIQTELARHMTPELMDSMRARFIAAGEGISTFRFKTVPQGAATQVWCGFVATADAIGGRYCEDCHVCEVNDTATRNGVRSYALDPARAEALWELSDGRRTVSRPLSAILDVAQWHR
jgi:NAD(P)-dependent dehydrogenase (short-subunit alcohol dehydrogenase family)